MGNIFLEIRTAPIKITDVPRPVVMASLINDWSIVSKCQISVYTSVVVYDKNCKCEYHINHLADLNENESILCYHGNVLVSWEMRCKNCGDYHPEVFQPFNNDENDHGEDTSEISYS